MLRVFVWCVAGAHVSAFSLGSARGRGRALQLAPRDTLVEEFLRICGGTRRITADAAAGSRPIAELLATGDLQKAELDELWGGLEGLDVNGMADVEGFVRLCDEIEDLFEAEDEDEAEDAAAAAAVEAAAAKAVETPVVELTSRERLLSLLPPAGECRVQDREAEATARDEAILAAIEAVARDTALSANSAQERASMVRQLCGNWELAFTSSPSFNYNRGFTGVAMTTPGGAEFVRLEQRLTSELGVNAVTYVETLRPSLGAKAVEKFDVTVSADWKVIMRLDPLSRDNRPSLECVARSVKYGPVSVAGDRVEKGWKAMRVLNSGVLALLDDEIRVQKGTTAWFVWRRLP